MRTYSDFVDALVQRGDLLSKLRPSSASDVGAVVRIREAADGVIAGEKAIADTGMFALVRAGLFYLCDEIDTAHKIIQGVDGDTGAYWHGMVHRREGDFDNARYWFRRAGALPLFGEIHRAAANASPVVSAQSNWDPYLFTGLCEQERFGANENLAELLKLQRIEFDALFDYVWRKGVA